MRVEQDQLKRFESFIAPEPNTGCWLWTGFITHDGYGKFWLCGKNVMAHRFAYDYFRGPIPEGMTLDHTCKLKCANPWHVEPATMRDNVLRNGGPSAINAAKLFCVAGHPFSQENTYVTSTGRRQCRVCGLRRTLKYQEKKRG